MYITIIDYCTGSVFYKRVNEKEVENTDIETLLESIYPAYDETQCNYMISPTLEIKALL